MSSRKLVIDGTTCILAHDVARIVHLAPDYISRLARGELIEGRIVNGLWFVSLKEIWRAELARKRREEQILAGHPSALLRTSSLQCVS